VSGAAPRISIEDQVACVEREIRQRARVYPRWVEAGRMTQAKADLENARMAAVLETLQEKAKEGRLI